MKDASSSGTPLSSLLTPENIHALEKASPGASFYFILDGGMRVSEFKIDKIENNQGSFSMGDGSSSAYNNHTSAQGIEEITQLLIELIGKNSDMPEDTKEELKGTVSAISEQALSDKPNKSIMAALYGTVDKAITLASKSTELVSAFEKWKDLIAPIFN